MRNVYIGMASIFRSYYIGTNYIDIQETEVSFERSSDIFIPLGIPRNWPVSIGNALLLIFYY